MKAQELFKALADDTRLLATLLIRQEGELCVCELTAALAQSQPKVSRHLAQLRRLGLLADRRQGQWVFYRISPALAGWAEAILQQAETGAAEPLAQVRQRLKQMQSRPQRAAVCCTD